jgi:pimeloyl-ACP methyl ester carboxylesterase
VNTQVSVIFSQPIAKASLTASNLVLSSPSGPVEATLTLSPLGTEATLYPAKALASQTTYSLIATQAIQDTHNVFLASQFTSQFTTANAPPPPPPAGSITVSFPDDQGNVTVTATQGTAPPDTLTLLINTESGSIASANVRPDGSFTTSLFAQLGDELLVVLRDEAGRQTVASAGAYVHPDGRRIVTAAGGSIPAAGGATLTLAPQAVTMPTTLRTSMVDPSDFSIALPPGYRVLPGLRIEMDRPLKTAARLSVPLPQDLALSPDARPFLARTQVIGGETVLVMVDSMRVLNNELTTSSPPFPGLQEAGVYQVVIPALPIPVLLQGTVTTTLPNGAIQPVAGIVVRVTDNPHVVTTRKDGTFAISAYPTSFETQNITLTVMDPATSVSKSAAISMQVLPSGPVVSYRQDFSLPGGLQLVDTTPPTLTLALSGSGVKGSIIPLGTEATLTVTAMDDRVVADGTAIILVNGRALGVGIAPGNMYSARFLADTIGLAQIEALVADTSGNIGRVVRRIQVIDPTTRPPSIPGAPVVLETRPDKDTAGANVFDQLYVRFSEPVRNLTTDTVRLEKLNANDAPTGPPIPLLLSPDVPDSTVELLLYPQQNLEFATRYRLTLTTGIHDWDAEQEGAHLAEDDIRDFATVGLTKLPEKLVSGNLRAVEPLDETRLVLLDRRQGLRVVDVTDPSNPKPFGDFAPPWGGYYIGFQALKVVPDFAYRTANGLVVKTPVAVVVGYFSLPGEPIAGYLAVVSLATPASPRVIGRAVLGVDTDAVPMDVLVKGSYAVVGSLAAGLQIVDLDAAIEAYACQRGTGSSCIGKPRDDGTGTGRYEDPLLETYGFGAQPIAAPFGLVASKKNPDAAYVAERARGIYRLELGGLPYLEKTLLFATPAFHLALAEDVQRGEDEKVDLLVLATSQGLAVLNLTDPSVPPAMLSDGLETGIFGVTAHPGHGLAFVTTGTGGLAVVDLRAQQPTVVGARKDLGFANGAVMVNDQFAYVAAAGTGLEIVKYHPEGITLDLVDALAFTPWGDPTNGLQGFTHAPAAKIEMDQSLRREGALADGASLLVLRVKVPPYGIGDESVDLRLTFTLSEPPGASSQGGSAEELGSLYDGMGAWPLFSDPNAPGVPTEVTISIPTTPKEGGIGAVVYRPPTKFVRDARDDRRVLRPIQITMTFDPAQVRDTYGLRTLKETTELAAGHRPLAAKLSLVRPPLVLVHGIYSSKATWQDLYRTLLAELPQAFVYAPVDYSDRNSSGFETIYTAVRDTVRTTLTSLRQGTVQADDFNRERLLGFRRIAATRLDLLAHSMGGLATRYYIGQAQEFRRTDNYFFGDLGRIITVGTPYKGAAIARWFEWKWWPIDTQTGVKGEYRARGSDPVWALKQNLGKGNTLALRDMTPGSQVQRQFERVRDTEPVSLRGPRVHTVIGITNDAYGVESALWFSKALALEAMPLEPDRSDRLVCVQSQRGAMLAPSASSELLGVTHTQEPASGDLRVQLLRLLNQADGETQFDGSGMPPSGEVGLDVPWEFTCPEPGL